LGTDNGDGTACFGTRPADQVPIIWPYGSSARRNPLRVLDAKGRTIAVDGQTVNLGGGFAPVQTGHLIGCGAADTAWVVISLTPGPRPLSVQAAAISRDVDQPPGLDRAMSRDMGH